MTMGEDDKGSVVNDWSDIEPKPAASLASSFIPRVQSDLTQAELEQLRRELPLIAGVLRKGRRERTGE